MRRAALFLVLLIVLAFSLGAWMQPRMIRTTAGRESDNMFQAVMGEGRRMFANHFAVKADVYMHSGMYPSMFDQAAAKELEEATKAEPETHEHTADCKHEEEGGHEHTAECQHDTGEEHKHADEHEKEGCPECSKCDTSFMGQPRDWIEAMGRHFMVTEHTHLTGGKEREVLPWVKLAVELDPERIEAYVVGAYWLERMNKPDEAVDFLRQGLRANPRSHEILFELGRINFKRLKQPERARNIWKLALRRWEEVEAAREKPDTAAKGRIFSFLGELELTQGDSAQAIRYWEEARPFSPQPAALDERIKAVRSKATPAP